MLLMLAALLALQSMGTNAPGAKHPAANPSGANAPSAPHARPATCAVVEIRSDRDRHDRYRFSATRILELRFETRLSGPPKREHTLRLRLNTPSGFLYQVLAVPVEAGRNGLRRVEARLPVAGTSIMASGLYGRWTVVPELDDSSEPCGPGRHFVIRP
jgi:hypothetical protein